MTGYKVNLCTKVNSDEFLNLPNESKLLWLYLYHDAFDPFEDSEPVYNHPISICRMLGAPADQSFVSKLVEIHALIPVTYGNGAEALQGNGGVTHG